MTAAGSQDTPALPALKPRELDMLRGLETCVVANAIETTGVRLRNEGYMDATVRCVFPDFPPVLGYAMTLKVRTGNPPIEGPGYVDRVDWWDQLLALPQPRLLVVEDDPGTPASGSFLGEVHANILRALGCSGMVTNGAVRDLPALRRLGFPVFAGHVSVSHAYAHIVEAGAPVTVGGLRVQPGDLIHGDMHGVLSIPLQVAREIPAIAARQKLRERRIVDFCNSVEFDVDGLKRLLDRDSM